MESLHKFLVNNEVQSNIINSSKDDKENFSLRVKGNFSWGFKKTEDEKEEKDKKKEEETKDKSK